MPHFYPSTPTNLLISFSTLQANHEVCHSDSVKLKLVNLWEEGLYREFLLSRRNPGEPVDLDNVKAHLSSSMRYKLRKKTPCPIELENEMRVKNARLPKPVHDGLNSWLKKHQENPYPNKAEKEALSSKLGITPQQVRRHTFISIFLHSFPVWCKCTRSSVYRVLSV